MRFSIYCLCLVILSAVPGCSETDTPISEMLIDGTVTLTGVVLDTHSTPVANMVLFIEYIQVDPDRSEVTSGYLQNKTDTTGHFSFSNVKPGQIQFRLVPGFAPKELTRYRLLSVKIGEVLYYPNDLSSPYYTDYVAAFSVADTSTSLEGIEVRVKEKMRIRAEVTFKNGMPLANYPLYLSTSFHGLTRGGYGSTTQIRTDIDGDFTRYVARTGYYRLTVKYQGLAAVSERFLLNDGENREDLVLTFDSQPIPRSLTPGDWWE